MIPRILPGRHDNRTSFRRLTDYIVKGLEANGIDPRMVSFDDLTRYIVSATTSLDDLEDGVEKTLAVEIGNLVSLRTAATEMWAVASQNPRVEDPILHYMISWPEHERPPTEDMLDAAKHTLDALGLGEHQYVMAIHINTDNLHVHVEVNCVHPLTFKSHHLEFPRKTLHRAAREMEIKYGWHHDNGLFVVVEIDGQKRIIEADDAHKLDPDFATPLTRAAQFEAWSGRESFETWCKDEPAKVLKRALDKKEIQSWTDVHRLLAEQGVELGSSGGGGYRVTSLPQPGDDQPPVAIAASKVFRFLKPVELAKRIGEFVPYDPATMGARQKPERVYKRDPLKRLVRRLDRKEAREDLFKRFEAEKALAENTRYALKRQVKADVTKKNRERFDALRKSYTQTRNQIRNDASLSSAGKQQAYMLAKLTHERSVAELRKLIRGEQQEINTLLPRRPSWRAWLEQQAALGDEAAISALRGIAYRDRRDGRTDAEAPDHSGAAVKQPPSLSSAILDEDEDDPIIRPVHQLEWRVTTNGRVLYAFPAKDAGGSRLAFIDEGRRIAYAQSKISERALVASLEYAKMKWGPNLRLNGGDEIFRRRVIEVALTLGMRVTNPELQADQAKLLATQLIVNREEVSHGRSHYEINPDRARAGHRAAALRQSRIRQHGPERPAESLTGVRHLSGLAMAQDQSVAEMLLPRHAPDRVGQRGAEGPADPGMRRARTGADQAPGRVGGTARQEWTGRELAKLRIKTPGLTISDADPAVTGRQYDGRIEAVTDTHVIQRVKADEVVLHELSRLAAIPKRGALISIKYRGGIGQADTLGKGRGGR